MSAENRDDFEQGYQLGLQNGREEKLATTQRVWLAFPLPAGRGHVSVYAPLAIQDEDWVYVANVIAAALAPWVNSPSTDSEKESE